MIIRCVRNRVNDTKRISRIPRIPRIPRPVEESVISDSDSVRWKKVM